MSKSLTSKLKKAYKSTELMPFVHPSYFDNDNFRLNQKLDSKGMFEVYVKDDDGFKARIFGVKLYSILTNKNVPIGRTKLTFDGTKFQKPYMNGFKKGSEYFTRNYPQELFVSNQEKYIKSLQVCYFQQEPIKKKKGWIFWERSYPMNLSDEIAEEYGFFSGVLNELKNMIYSHAGEFENFYAVSASKQADPRDKGGLNLTWDEVIFTYNYKQGLGEETEVRQGADWKRLYGQAAANACSRVDNQKKPNQKQYPKIIRALQGYEAQKSAINDMEVS